MSCVLPYHGHAEISCQENGDFYQNLTTQQLHLVRVETTLHSDAATIRNNYVVCLKQLTNPYLFIYSIIYSFEVFIYLALNNKASFEDSQNCYEYICEIWPPNTGVKYLVTD